MPGDERDRAAVTPARDLCPLVCPGRGGHGSSAPDQRDSGRREGRWPSLQHQEIPKPRLAWKDPLQRIREGWHSVGHGQAHPVPGTAATFCSRRKIQNKTPAAGMPQPLVLTPGRAAAAGGRRKPGLQAALCPANHCKTDLY